MGFVGVVTAEAEATEVREVLDELRTLMGQHVEPVKWSVAFERTVQPRQYESAKLNVRGEVAVDPGADDEEIIGAIRHLCFQIKSKVFEELGLEMEISDNGILMEVVRQSFPGAELSNDSVDRIKSTASAAANQPPHDPKTADKAERRANSLWALERFETHDHEFWDNRGNKTNPKSPDIKHKATGIGGWFD